MCIDISNMYLIVQVLFCPIQSTLLVDNFYIVWEHAEHLSKTLREIYNIVWIRQGGFIVTSELIGITRNSIFLIHQRWSVMYLSTSQVSNTKNQADLKTVYYNQQSFSKTVQEPSPLMTKSIHSSSWMLHILWLSCWSIDPSHFE